MESWFEVKIIFDETSVFLDIRTGMLREKRN